MVSMEHVLKEGNMSKKNKVFGALAAMVTLAVMAPFANAAPIDGVDASRNGTSSITVHKYKLNDQNGKVVGDGTQLGENPGEPLDGAVFKLQKVKTIGDLDVSGLDFTTNKAYSDLSKKVDANGQPEGDVTYETEGEKQSDGKADFKFENLKFGVYYVTETTAPKDASTASPFYVTLPMGSNNGFLYDVHAYPKNAVEHITKTLVDDSNFKAGTGDIVYNIEQSVMPYQNGVNKFQISDKLDSRLTYKSSEVTLSTGEAVTEGQDYEIATEAENTVVLKWKNFELMNKVASASTKLNWKLTTTFNSGTDSNNIENKATSIPNQDPKWVDNPLESEKVINHLMNVQINKTDAKTKKALEGAKFKLREKASGEFLKFRDCNSGKATLVEEVTTSAEGKAGICDINLGEIKEGVPVNTLPETASKYEVVESEAPDGYTRLTAPLNLTEGTIDTQNNSVSVSVDVENSPNSIFGLPKTGAAGVIGISAAAVVLLAAGGVVLYRVRRNRKDEEGEIKEAEVAGV